MESIAQGHMDIDMDAIDSIKESNHFEVGACNKKMLQKWANKNNN